MKTSLESSFDGLPKFILGFIGTIIFRMLSPYLGMWNISPLMATELAGSKAYGPWIGGVYGVMSIFFVDLLMGKLGSWTFITSLTYGVVGVLGAYYLKDREAGVRNFVMASVAGALFFDLITGVLMGPILYGQPWMEAIVGQIPFTLRHVIGNTFFAVTLAPWFYKKIMINPRLAISHIFKFA